MPQPYSPIKRRSRTNPRSLLAYMLLGFSLMLLCILAALFFYYEAYRSRQEEYVYRQYNTLISQIEKEFSTVYTTAEQICTPYARDYDMQNYLLNRPTEDAMETYRLAKKALDFASYSASSGSTGQVCFYSNTGRYMISDESYYPLFKTVIDRSQLSSNINLNWSFISIVKNEEEQREYLVFVFPYETTADSAYSSVPTTERHLIYGMYLVDPNSLISEIDPMYETAAVALISNQHLLASSRYLSEEELKLTENILPNQKRYTTAAGISYHTERSLISQYGYSLVYMVPEGTIESELSYVRSFSILIFIIITLFFLLFILVMLLSVGSSLRHLLQDIENAGNGASRLGNYRFYEFSQISTSVNHMLDTIEQVQEEKGKAEQALLQAQLEQQSAQMMAYRSQINPHFIFNALETMRSMAQYVEEVPLTKMIISLSSMLRHVLYTDSYTTLAKEAASLSDYMEIIQIRFSGRYRFIPDLAPETRGCRCLCMMLQPFAENSINYAFVGYRKKAAPTIYVRSRLDRDTGNLLVDIIDNGIGIEAEKLKAIEENYRQAKPENLSDRSFSIGLSNVYKRLKLAYGKHCHLKITSSYGHYTKVTIVIPQKQ